MIAGTVAVMNLRTDLTQLSEHQLDVVQHFLTTQLSGFL
jgi:hypothetical protein